MIYIYIYHIYHYNIGIWCISSIYDARSVLDLDLLPTRHHSLLCHIFSQSNPTPKTRIKWQSFTFIPLHTTSYHFIPICPMKFVWKDSVVDFMSSLEGNPSEKMLLGWRSGPERLVRLQKVHGLFSLGKRTSHRKSCRNCSSISGRIQKYNWSTRAPPTWKRTSIVMSFEILYFNVTKVNKKDGFERWLNPSRLVFGYARIVLDAHTLMSWHVEHPSNSRPSFLDRHGGKNIGKLIHSV